MYLNLINSFFIPSSKKYYLALLARLDCKNMFFKMHFDFGISLLEQNRIITCTCISQTFRTVSWDINIAPAPEKRGIKFQPVVAMIFEAKKKSDIPNYAILHLFR